MLSYLLMRWRLARLFEPHEGDYLFRRRATDEGKLVTPEERVKILRQFRSEYWRTHALLWLCCILVFGVAIGIAVLGDAPETFIATIAYGAAIVFVIAVIFLNQRVLDNATKAVADCPIVSPARNWSQLRREGLQKASWWRIARNGPLLALIAWATFPSSSAAGWLWLVWIAYFTLGFGIWGLNIVQKANLERRG